MAKHRHNSRSKASQRVSFAERLRRCRQRLKLTRPNFAELIREKTGYPISASTLRDMENRQTPYRPPQKWQERGEYEGPHGSAIEAVAQAADVPVGYLLAGFEQEELRKSCFWSLIEDGQIKLQDTLEPETRLSTFREFLAWLPNTEAELLNLPWHEYLNERAFAVIFRLEKVFHRLEMLLVNEPPLIFWDDEDVEEWVRNMALRGDDARAFRDEFSEYRQHFRTMVEQGRKHYKVVLNRDSFMAWLGRKDPKHARTQIELMRKFNRLTAFSLALVRGGNRVEEAEIISGFVQIPSNYARTLAVQIEQSPPHGGLTEYSVTPRPRSDRIIRRQHERIEGAWKQAVDEMRREAQAAGVNSTSLRDTTDLVLSRIGEGFR